jgi:hypothetical protein
MIFFDPKKRRKTGLRLFKNDNFIRIFGRNIKVQLAEGVREEYVLK